MEFIPLPKLDEQGLTAYINYLAKDAEYDTRDYPNYIDPEGLVLISEDQADELEEAGQEIYAMCLAAVEKIINENRFAEFGVGPMQAEMIKASWNRQGLSDGTTRDPELACRIDFAWNGKDKPKFYEVNGDCYTTLYECAVVQWKVVERLQKQGAIPSDMSQFNTLEEKITARLEHIRRLAQESIGISLHLAANSAYEEDLTTVNYLRYLADQAGWDARYVEIDHIGINDDPRSPDFNKLFDANNKQIRALYKLNPWEHIFEGDFKDVIAKDKVLFIEPAWRALLSNKMLSVLLWEMYPEHPLLLPAYKTPENLGDKYVQKPIFGRIGSGVKIIDNTGVTEKTSANHGEDYIDYSKYPPIYQAFHPLPSLKDAEDYVFQTGIWVVGNGDVAGMDIRRDKSLVVGSKDIRFVPHIMQPRID